MSTTTPTTHEPKVMTSGAAALADKSQATIVTWANLGILPCERLANGFRLFVPADVRRVAAERAARARH